MTPDDAPGRGTEHAVTGDMARETADGSPLEAPLSLGARGGGQGGDGQDSPEQNGFHGEDAFHRIREKQNRDACPGVP